MQFIFVNLPLKDLNASMDFFKKLGYSLNSQFTNHKAACMIVLLQFATTISLVMDFWGLFAPPVANL